MVADIADGVVGSVLAHGRYPDGPGSQPPFAAEDDLNPERAKRGLYPTQPAGECAETLRPARPDPSGHGIAANIDAELQKVGRGSVKGRPAKPTPDCAWQQAQQDQEEQYEDLYVTLP
jgi:hypothetical protein